MLSRGRRLGGSSDFRHVGPSSGNHERRGRGHRAAGLGWSLSVGAETHRLMVLPRDWAEPSNSCDKQAGAQRSPQCRRVATRSPALCSVSMSACLTSRARIREMIRWSSPCVWLVPMTLPRCNESRSPPGRRFLEVGMDEIAADEPTPLDVLTAHVSDGRAWTAVDGKERPVGYLLASQRRWSRAYRSGKRHPESARARCRPRPHRPGCSVGRSSALPRGDADHLQQRCLEPASLRAPGISGAGGSRDRPRAWGDPRARDSSRPESRNPGLYGARNRPGAPTGHLRSRSPWTTPSEPQQRASRT